MKILCEFEVCVIVFFFDRPAHFHSSFLLRAVIHAILAAELLSNKEQLIKDWTARYFKGRICNLKGIQNDELNCKNAFLVLKLASNKLSPCDIITYKKP